MRWIAKPVAGEYPDYAAMYINLLPNDGSIVEQLARNVHETANLVASLPPDRLAYRYAPGKWTVKDIVGHITDDERIYTYRALRFARGDTTELPGFEQDDFARVSNAGERPIADLLRELAAVRAATVQLFSGFDDAALIRSGIANGYRSSVRALGYHIAGHELHHVQIIRKRYVS